MKFDVQYRFQKGVTLLELLVVLAIIAIVSGMGLALLSHSDKQFAFFSTRGAIISMLRYARNVAIAEKMPTSVVIDVVSEDEPPQEPLAPSHVVRRDNPDQRTLVQDSPQAKQIYCLVPRTIGLWHFEDNQNGITTGALGYNGKLSPELQIISQGKYGKAVLFNGSGIVDYDNLPDISAEDLQNGLIWDVWVYPEEAREQVIIEGSIGSITLQKDGSLTGRVGALIVTTPANQVVIQRWSHIRMLHQNKHLTLFVNYDLAGEAKGEAKLSSYINTLTIGSRKFPLKGKIDEVRISLYAKATTHQLKPEDIVITPAPSVGPIRFQFDARGRFAGISKSGRIKFSSNQAQGSFKIEITPLGTILLK